MKLVPFFFAFFLPSPDREAIRRIRKNAKTNNKASHPGGLFYLITTKATSMTEENPLLALRDKISAWTRSCLLCWRSAADWLLRLEKPNWPPIVRCVILTANAICWSA